MGMAYGVCCMYFLEPWWVGAISLVRFLGVGVFTLCMYFPSIMIFYFLLFFIIFSVCVQLLRVAWRWGISLCGDFWGGHTYYIQSRCWG
ncbi:hypothetical protein FN846DRAFT_932701 [Sphaerosporella brunnea]|uniref:Uncharacterized protein n=1 Tax=Sphaerosporella brunnea TaxID=1250544 RepID=A0A5J5F6V4_9PEZI|nr:hypothetical protein FN846DRAFT_932701 [Sphaerosporella brunnea]